MMYLGGTVLGSATHEAAHDVFCYLRYAYGLECKRIDLALDDYEKSVSMEELEAASRAGDYAYAHRSKIIEEGPRKGVNGKTVYFGSPKSNKLLRVYDKTVESDGAIDAIRWESQFRDSQADQIFGNWVNMAPSELATKGTAFLAEVVVGTVQFCDRSDESEEHISNCPELPWWTAFKQRVGQGVRITAAKKKPLLEDSLNWITRAVMPKLSMVRKIFAEGFQAYFESEMSAGEKRHNYSHKAIIEQSKLDGWCPA
jgi:DNA relaxase NicK